MPKPLSPDQLQTLQANGVVVPGFEAADVPADTALPAGLVIRTLGSVGLPHAETVDRMDGTDATPTGSLETLNSPRLVESETPLDKPGA